MVDGILSSDIFCSNNVKLDCSKRHIEVNAIQIPFHRSNRLDNVASLHNLVASLKNHEVAYKFFDNEIEAGSSSIQYIPAFFQKAKEGCIDLKSNPKEDIRYTNNKKRIKTDPVSHCMSQRLWVI